MGGLEFVVLAQQCAPNVHHQTLAALANIESSFNPYAIGVVGGRLSRQPQTKAEAIEIVNYMMARNIKFSAGLIQVFRPNWAKYGLTVETVFDPCQNLAKGSAIFLECFDRVPNGNNMPMQMRLKFSASCYNSGNYTTGFRNGYVNQFVRMANAPIGRPVRRARGM